MHLSTTPSLSQTTWPRRASRQFLTLSIVETLLPVTFAYSPSSEAVVLRRLRRWKRLWRRSLTRSYKRTSMGPSRSCWNGTSALQPEEITSKGTRVLCVFYQWKCPYEKILETYLMILVYKHIYTGFDINIPQSHRPWGQTERPRSRLCVQSPERVKVDKWSKRRVITKERTTMIHFNNP